MSLPPDTGLTIAEVRRIAATFALRRGIAFDPALLADVDALAEEIVLDQALAGVAGDPGTPCGVYAGGERADPCAAIENLNHHFVSQSSEP